MENIMVILGLLFVVTFIILYFWSIIWGYKDAVVRGKNGFAVAALITLFAWPFGLLFWTIIRPEDIKAKEKTIEQKQSPSQQNKYLTDFKEMPFLLKLLFIGGLYSLISTTLNFIQMKPVVFQYFNSGFPKNYPFIWYLYYLLLNIATIIVYFKRSYAVLKKYLYISMGIVIITLLNSIYVVVNLPTEQKIFSIIIYTFTYIFGGLIFVYLLSQKKYFNRM